MYLLLWASLTISELLLSSPAALRFSAAVAKLCSCGSLLNLSAAELRSPPSISRSLRSISFGVFWIAVTRSKFGQSVSLFSLHSLIASCVWTDERPSCRPSSRLFSRPSQRCVVLVLARASASRSRHYYYLLSASDACAAPLTARLSSSPSPPPSARSVWPPWRGSSSLFSSRASRARAAAAAAARLLEPLLFSFPPSAPSCEWARYYRLAPLRGPRADFCGPRAGGERVSVTLGKPALAAGVPTTRGVSNREITPVRAFSARVPGPRFAFFWLGAHPRV